PLHGAPIPHQRGDGDVESPRGVVSVQRGPEGSRNAEGGRSELDSAFADGAERICLPSRTGDLDRPEPRRRIRHLYQSSRSVAAWQTICHDVGRIEFGGLSRLMISAGKLPEILLLRSFADLNGFALFSIKSEINSYPVFLYPSLPRFG